jgi:RNA polymerase sigma factor (sigma-70 family)
MDLEALLRAARDGEPGAWKALHPPLHRELRAYFLREFDESTAAELTQRTVESLVRQLPGFVPRESLRQWAFGIARNQGRREHQAHAQNQALGELAARIMKTPNTSPTERVYAKELITMLLEEIEKLPSRLRRVIEHDLEHGIENVGTEFARREGIQPATVWSRRYRAITMLRDRLMARLNPPQPSPRVADSTSSSSSPPA